jgi:hypothetical protein
VVNERGGERQTIMPGFLVANPLNITVAFEFKITFFAWDGIDIKFWDNFTSILIRVLL